MNKTSIRIFRNGRIHTMRGREVVSALTCETQSGTILATGSDREIISRFKSCQPEMVDLEGLTVLPGFSDCHTHFCSWALLNFRPNLDAARSLKECLEIVASYVNNKQPGQWIVGGGWNRNIWTDQRMPVSADLNTVSINNPVFLWSKDWHTAWVNSAAVTMFNITPGQQVATGGVIEQDDKGRASGILREEAANHYFRLIPKATQTEYENALVAGQKKFARMGLTGFHTMETQDEFALLQSLDQQGKLSLRGVYYLREQALEKLVELKLCSGFGNNKLKFGGIKLFADGSLGSQTAHLLEPYENSPSRGMPTPDPDALLSFVRTASANGIACAVHAIGDAANRMALDIFEQTKDSSRNLRHRIEHCQLVHPDDIVRFNALGIIASVQPVHCPSDLDLIERYWGARGKDAYPFGSLKKNKAKLCFGSDAPIETPDPFQAIQAAVTRQRIPADRPPFHPEQRLSVYDAVKAYTSEAAYASGDERWKGTLEPGKVADFICLSDDIFTIDSGRIHRIKVVRTVIDGKIV
ncbi:MAG: amidohydrolase [Candidatus Edwardsbacteria bacterium]|nr:amidohydrolase [Candidatus Edwardsbacteria bacterium]